MDLSDEKIEYYSDLTFKFIKDFMKKIGDRSIALAFLFHHVNNAFIIMHLHEDNDLTKEEIIKKFNYVSVDFINN